MQFNIDSAFLEGAHTIETFGSGNYYPFDYTGAKDELLACREGAWLGSHLNVTPTYDLYGKDVIKFLNHYCVNSDFAKTTNNKGRHVLICNEKGQLLADGVLIRIGENRFRTFWLAPVIAVFQATCGMDVQGNVVNDEYFFQIDGPRSLEILEKACQCDLHDLKFAMHRVVKIEGMDMRVLRLGMSGALAYEVHGPEADANKVFDIIRETGREFGLKPLGNRQYCVNHTQAGYPNQFVHFTYPYATGGPALAAATQMQSEMVGPGSCREDKENYYVTPYDVGWGYLVNFNRDFVGKEALQKLAANPPQTPVTLEWDPDDVADVYASQYRGTDVEPYDPIDAPKDFGDPAPGNTGFRMDKVLVGGKQVGRASGRINDYYHRRVISLAFINKEFAREGTDVIVLWGTPGNPQKEIRARVARFPYYNEEYRNETFDVEKIPHPVFAKEVDYSNTKVDGIYNIEVEAGGSKQLGSFTYKTNGNVLTGTATAMGVTSEITDGKVDKNRFEHTMKMKTPLGEMKIKVKGKVEGDVISGVFKVMMMSMPFSGKRG